MSDAGILAALADAGGRAGEGLLAGLLNGATLGFGDEVFGGRMDFERAFEDAPIAYTLGVLPGALGYGLVGKFAGQAGFRSPWSRMAASGALGGLHGAAAGAGGLIPGDHTGEERAREAAILALLGAGVGAGAVPATRAAMDLGDNLPALLGRVRTPVADGDIVRQGALGQGTRRSAPITIRYTGEGDAAARAERALRLGMAADEREALERGAGAFERYGSGELRPLDAPLGRTARSAVDIAAESPAGGARLNAEADGLMSERAMSYLRGARRPDAGKGRKRAPADVMDAMASTLGRPEYHDAWVAQAKAMPPNQRRALADQLTAYAREVAARSQTALADLLEDRNFLAKAEAVGLKIPRRGRMQMLTQAERADIEALRARAEPRGRYADAYDGFANPNDRLLSRRGEMSADDALAMLDAALSPRRMFHVPPSPSGALPELLEGSYERGARFNPRGYLTRGEEAPTAHLGMTPTEAAIFYSQPAAAALHLAPSWLRDRPDRDEGTR